MSSEPTISIERKIPRRKDAALFRIKTTLLTGRRFVSDAADRGLVRHPLSEDLREMQIIARSVSQLWTDTDDRERRLVAGKIQNLRMAVGRINGIAVGARETFSFWKQVGRATSGRGFVEGRELREGCIIPAIGGGLCQLSNALYDAALQAGCEIIERHAHTRVIPGSLSEIGRDATVFWNYVDLRFRAAASFRIDARLTDSELIVEFRGAKNSPAALYQIDRAASVATGSCETCEVGDCHRVIPAPRSEFGRRAFLLDEFSPEFGNYVEGSAASGDLMFVPIDGRRFRKPNYAWEKPSGVAMKQSVYVTAKRSWISRKLAAQGSKRQMKLLAMSDELACDYSRRLSYDALHLTIHQNLLPYLWRTGALGGRTFDVLMNALPMAEIQRRLDAAHALHPESLTLADFRADEGLIRAETEALARARRIITSHSLIASIFGERAEKLDWRIPVTTPRQPLGLSDQKKTILFPATTVGRKGCYELREAVRSLDVRVLTMGPMIESEDFWSGFDVEPAGDKWETRVDAVVLPAFIEHKPRRLLRAASFGIPVIASDACGVDGIPGINIVPSGDTAALRECIQDLFECAIHRVQPRPTLDTS